MPRNPDRSKALRNARSRLLRYLLRGGRLVRDESGHYCRATRSGEPFEGKLVDRLIERGCMVSAQEHQMAHDLNSRTWALRPVGD